MPLNLKQIQAMATGTESKVIRHDLAEDSLNELRSRFVDVELRKLDEETQLAEIKKEFKLRIDALKGESGILKKKLRERFEDIDTEVYIVKNHDTRMMEYYHKGTGELVETRKMRPEERQMDILQAKVA